MENIDKIKKFFDMPMAWKCPSGLKACLHVTGADALSFLQGQLTQDLRSSATRAAAYGLLLSQKGKVLADVFALREADDDVWLVSFSMEAQALRERLEAYVVADDVVIEDVTAGWRGIVFGGREAGARLPDLPPVGEFAKVAGGFLFCGRRGGGVSWEWVAPPGAVPPADAEEIPAVRLERLRVASGIARVPQDIGPGDLPNEGGLEAVAVSYTKGCYLGQEVMARLKAMGTVRRRLVRVQAAGRPVPALPCALLQGERRVGELRSAVEDGEGGFIGLALLTKLGVDPALPLAPEPGGEAHIELLEAP